jgi:hypothetical protein
MLMMLPKLARARRQIEKIAAEVIIFRQRCQGVNAGKRRTGEDLQQKRGGFVPRVGFWIFAISSESASSMKAANGVSSRRD